MKIKVKTISYEEFKNLLPYKHIKPRKQSWILNKAIKLVSASELKKVNFTYTIENMDKIDAKTPCLYLMNHSCILDLKIAFKLIKHHNFNIIMTEDGFIGKEKIIRAIGCIPTIKFLTDITLVKDIKYAVDKLHNSILMYPEAGYSIDGTATIIPDYLFKLVKMLNIPVVMIKTEGAYLHDPLYNNLQLRKVDVKASMKCILSVEDINSLSNKELQDIIEKEFTFDNFDYQQKHHIIINESFRADSLNRVLYKCPSCLEEHQMIGKNEYLECLHCHKKYVLQENGLLKALDGITEYPKISDWYRWQRKCVREDILNNAYLEELEVDIYGLKDFKALYKIGQGKLTHYNEGFFLEGYNMDLHYHQSIRESYSLNSDFYWYEIADIVCIGDTKARFYCVPTKTKDVVAKLRIATEELYKLSKENN